MRQDNLNLELERHGASASKFQFQYKYIAQPGGLIRNFVNAHDLGANPQIEPKLKLFVCLEP